MFLVIGGTIINASAMAYAEEVGERTRVYFNDNSPPKVLDINIGEFSERLGYIVAAPRGLRAVYWLKPEGNNDEGVLDIQQVLAIKIDSHGNARPVARVSYGCEDEFVAIITEDGKVQGPHEIFDTVEDFASDCLVRYRHYNKALSE